MSVCQEGFASYKLQPLPPADHAVSDQPRLHQQNIATRARRGDHVEIQSLLDRPTDFEFSAFRENR